ncbi:hypothetical protein ACE193_19175 [Bernardetia sp. OM2101]|uniref:hypothetical protein n=1 Tax=Bernardetia sp. OM2101 TaxID=3344876 RepID=UPI0035CEFEFA
MPTDTSILGFSNKWYKSGFENRILYQLTKQTTIYILPVEYYLATKFEALLGRGGTDLRISHDFEDIIYVVQNNENLINTIQSADSEVNKYLKLQFHKILENKNYRESVEAILPYGCSIDEIEFILEKLQALSN